MSDPSTEKKGPSDRSRKIKLYISIVIILAFITGLFLLGNFGLGLLSSLKVFGNAESLFKDHQQNAIYELERYAQTGSGEHDRHFLKYTDSMMSYTGARKELEKLQPNFSVVHENFKNGGVNRDEIEELIFVFKRLGNFEGIEKAIRLLDKEDSLNETLRGLAAEHRQRFATRLADPKSINELTSKLEVLDDQARSVGDEFKAAINGATRSTKRLLTVTMLAFAVVAALFCLGVLLFVRNVFKGMLKDRLELQEKEWKRSGYQILSEVMQGGYDVPTLASRVVTCLCEFLDANVGALYTMDDDDRLRLAGSYAYEKPKGPSHEFSLGEGLIGQAALEKKYILLTHCPEDYIHIQSGLGSTPPKNIIAYPLVREGVLKGVIELGSLHEFSERDIQYLITATRNVAFVIEATQSRYKMAALLERTQQQAEELQVQEEELRQTNEELEEQAKALKESEEELRLQQEELKVTNQELEERSEDLGLQKDEVVRKNQDLESAKQLIEIKVQELEVTTKYKSEFLANMSHELRTPLNSLMILSSLLIENKSNNLTEKQLEYSRTINSAGGDLLNLINDILDLSKVEAGKVVLNLEDFDLSRLMKDVQAKIQPLARKKGLEFKVEIDGSIPGKIISDPQLLRQILGNLLSNAIKFTEKGRVALAIRKPSEEDLRVVGLPVEETDGYLACSVEDTGIGIAEDKQQVVFEAFQQADGSIQRKFGGTGLGLSISRELSRLLGGGIRLESELGLGSQFTIVIPLAGRVKKSKDSWPTVEPEEAGEKEEIGSPTAFDTDPSGPAQAWNTDEMPIPLPLEVENIPDDRRDLSRGDKSILVIEDDPDFARTLMEMARERGFKALVAWEGGAALHLADFYLPSAILLDLGLPGGMNGLTVLTKLKENLNTRHIPVHIISGHEKQREALRMGAVGYLLKPVNLDQINGVFNRLQSLIGKQVKRLLVVEDNEIQSNSLKELLLDEKVEVVTAFCGEEALKAIKKNDFDCIVLDLGLPDMSGIELLEKMRLSEKEPYVPVIVYTGKELTDVERAMLDKYAERVMVKDVRSPERLLDETALFMHRVENDLPEEKRRVIRMLHDREAIFDGRKVLVVDDDMRNVFALTSVLEEKGLELLVASDGQECLDMLEETPDINLVLMDIMMPVMDGYEAIRRIRSQKRFSNLPIITLTAKAMKGDRAACIEAGASDYLSKPVDTEKLVSMLRVWLYQ